jgi:PKD repeat protein
VHTYTTAGDYTVILTATNNGGSSSCRKVNYIHVGPPVPPVANFTSDIWSGIEPLTVHFTDKSTGYITGWQWNFDDGTVNYTGQNPVHTYDKNAAGLHNVTLTVSNAGGSSTMMKMYYINVMLPPVPVADFTATPDHGTVPLTVTFTDRSTNSPNKWQWDFGDGSAISPSQNTVHQYTTAGTFTVSLWASSDGGTSLVCQKQIGVTLPDVPVVDFSANQTTGWYAGASGPQFCVNFTDLTTGSALSSWQWNFGDGTGIDVNRNTVHTFTTPGVYNISLTVRNPGGSVTNTKTGLINLSIPPVPAVDFSANRTSGAWPLGIQFTSNVGGMYLGTYQWSFGDGSQNSTALNPYHSYGIAGTYTVTLTVYNPGGSSTLQKTGFVTVNGPSAPIVDFISNKTNGVYPLCVAFTDKSNLPSTSVYTTTWDWNFGDGTANSTLQNPIHTFTKPGVYSITLTVTNPGGTGSKQWANNITVTVPPAPVAAFTANRTTGFYDGNPFDVQFNDTSNVLDPSFYPTYYNWSFGDGSQNSSVRNATHTYNGAGTYNVMLTVTNEGGANTVLRTGYMTIVMPAVPVASFTATPDSGNTPVTVQFLNTSTGMFISSIRWDFGDGTGTVANVQNPSHTYTHKGTYTVTLTVQNPGGNATATRTITTVTVPPKAHYSASASTILSGQQVTLYDQSTEGTPAQWLWTITDNNGHTVTSTQQNPVVTLYADDSRGKAIKYDVTLYVENEGGSNSLWCTNYILVNPASIPMGAASGPANDIYTITVQDANGNYVLGNSTNPYPVGQYILQGGQLANPYSGYISPDALALPEGVYNITIYRNYAGGDKWGYELKVYDNMKLGQSVDTGSVAKLGMNNFLDQLQTRDRAGLVNFSSDVTLVAPLSKDMSVISNAVEGLNAVGATNIVDGMAMARSQFESNPRPEAKKIEILLTDAVDHDIESQFGAIYDEIRRASEENISIFTIGIANDNRSLNTTLLIDIAAMTKGNYYFVDPNDPMQLLDVLGAIGHKISEDITQNSTVDLITENDNVTYVDHSGIMTVDDGKTIRTYTGLDPYNWPNLLENGTHKTLKWNIPGINLGYKVSLSYTMTATKQGYTYPVSNLSFGTFVDSLGSTMPSIPIAGNQIYVRDNLTDTLEGKSMMTVQVIMPSEETTPHLITQTIQNIAWNVTYYGVVPYTWVVDCAPLGTSNFKAIASGYNDTSENATQVYTAQWNLESMNLPMGKIYTIRITATDVYGMFTDSKLVSVQLPVVYPGNAINLTSDDSGKKQPY